uniref:Tripartite motif-containing protein 56 n=1 Tax=Magallana gigas TaxID=29159 RepID=A0A8W8MSX5_MAGGI
MAELTSTQTDQESFRCPICLERLNIPRYLPCLHTFCEVCIQTYISSTATREEKGEFNVINCPVCRQQIKEPEKNISSEDWAKSLPLNKWILTMTANSETDSVINCLVCKRKNETVLANHWCKSCAEPICDECKDIHSRIPILQSHKIVEMNNTEKWNEAIDIDENCAIHKEKVVDIFCRDHNKLCCCVCFANQHRRCTNFDSIDEIVMNLDKSNMTDKLKSLSSLQDCIMELQEKNKKQTDALGASKDDICSSFAKKIEESKMLIDQAHEQWRKRFELEHAKHTDDIETVSDELKRFGTTVTEAKAMLSSVLKSGSDRQIFLVHWKLCSQIKDHFHRLKALKIWNLAASYSFETKRLDNITEPMQFEDVTLLKNQCDAIRRISVIDNTLLDGIGLPSPKPWLVTKDLMKTTFKKISEFETVGIAYFGIFIDDERVVISNETEKSLKVYDTSIMDGKLVCTHKCDDIPFDMCYAYGMNNIYIAFGQFVVMYEIKNRGLEFNELARIPVEGTVIGIAKTLDGLFTANDSSKSFRWDDFSIKSNLPYAKEGNRPFICSSLSVPGVYPSTLIITLLFVLIVIKQNK